MLPGTEARDPPFEGPRVSLIPPDFFGVDALLLRVDDVLTAPTPIADGVAPVDDNERTDPAV